MHLLEVIEAIDTCKLCWLIGKHHMKFNKLSSSWKYNYYLQPAFAFSLYFVGGVPAAGTCSSLLNRRIFSCLATFCY